MEPERFDEVLRVLTRAATRRTSLGLTLGGVVAVLGLAGSDAKKKKKKHKKKCKSCTECQICKKGKCKAKPEGSACIGGLCAAGTCSCFDGFKACQGRCIPEDSCCGSSECGGGGACQSGTCVCVNGFKRCENTCIPDGLCCNDSDCDGADECLHSGNCALTCPNLDECPGSCGCTTTPEQELVCFSYGDPPAPPCTRAACAGTTDCASGEECLEFLCDGENISRRCVQLC